jgi:hypothetical protein
LTGFFRIYRIEEKACGQARRKPPVANVNCYCSFQIAVEVKGDGNKNIPSDNPFPRLFPMKIAVSAGLGLKGEP